MIARVVMTEIAQLNTVAVGDHHQYISDVSVSTRVRRSTDPARSMVPITCPARIDVAYQQGSADVRNGSTTDRFDLPDATEEMTSMPQDAMPTDSVATSVPGDPSDAAELAAAAADDLAGATEAAIGN